METKLKSLNLQIENVKISSSHGSEDIKYQREVAVQFSYMLPESKSCASLTINETSNHFYHFRREVKTDIR